MPQAALAKSTGKGFPGRKFLAPSKSHGMFTQFAGAVEMAEMSSSKATASAGDQSCDASSRGRIAASFGDISSCGLCLRKLSISRASWPMSAPGILSSVRALACHFWKSDRAYSCCGFMLVVAGFSFSPDFSAGFSPGFSSAARSIAIGTAIPTATARAIAARASDTPRRLRFSLSTATRRPSSDDLRAIASPQDCVQRAGESP